AHRQIGRLRGLDAMNDIEDDHARIGRDTVIPDLAGARVATEDVEGDVAHQCAPAGTATAPVGLSSPRSGWSSSGTLGSGSVHRSSPSPLRRVTTFFFPH